MLEHLCRRQRRVVRSAFSGELNGLVATVEILLVIQIFYIKFGMAARRQRDFWLMHWTGVSFARLVTR